MKTAMKTAMKTKLPVLLAAAVALVALVTFPAQASAQSLAGLWDASVTVNNGALEIPFRWKKPRKIFVNSMSDLFHDKVSDAFIKSVWQVMADPFSHLDMLRQLKASIAPRTNGDFRREQTGTMGIPYQQNTNNPHG